jgi:Rod binding domain-containing protein
MTPSTAASASYASMLMAPMAKVAPPVAGQFAPTLTAAQARAALMTPAQRSAMEAKIAGTAKDFEAQFVGTMMGDMFNGIDLGGGQGAEAFKSVLLQAVGKKIASGRGIGLARSVQAEMLKLQGLS